MLSNEQVKTGLKVQWIRRNGDGARGVVRDFEQKSKGMWVNVESVDDKGKPTGKFTKVLAGQLSKR